MAVRRLAGARATPVAGTYPAWRGRFPELALPPVLDRFQPEVVVVSALASRPWATVRRHLAHTGTPCALYLRTADQVGGLSELPTPDLVLANAWVLEERARALGVEAVVIPSVVDTELTRVETTGKVALFVNPSLGHGLARVLALARARPDVPFVIQESKPIDRRTLAQLRSRLGSEGNVELRRVVDPESLYADARILLAPYDVPNRPRVVLEAHANGIPVLAADVAGLRECVPPGGILVAPGAPAAAWGDALGALWDDPVGYRAFAAAALRHAQRDEVRPGALVDRFELALHGLLDR